MLAALKAVAEKPGSPREIAERANLHIPTSGRVLLSLYRRSLVTISQESGRYCITQRGRDRLKKEKTCRSA